MSAKTSPTPASAPSPKEAAEEAPEAKGQKPKGPKKTKNQLMAEIADQQRAQVRQSLLTAADEIIDDGFEVGMLALAAGDAPEAIITTLRPYVHDANTLRKTAERYAPIERAS